MNNHKEAIQPIILLVTARLDYTLNGSGLIIAGWSVPHKLGGEGRDRRRLVLISFSFYWKEGSHILIHNAGLLGEKSVELPVREGIV